MREEEIRQAAEALWQYIEKKHLRPYLSDGVRYYRAAVTAAPDASTGLIGIQRPFDAAITVPYAWSAEKLTVGDQCLVMVFGEDANAIVVGDGGLNAADWATKEYVDDAIGGAIGGSY